MLSHDITSIIYQLTREDTKVLQYPYRSAQIKHTLISVSRKKSLEELLSQKSGEEKDNHTVYEVTLKDGTQYAVKCSDGYMYIGIGVLKEEW